MELLNVLINSIKNISVASIMDILVVTYIFYKIYMLIRETRAEQLLKGIILIVFLIPVSSLFNLTMLNWILTKTITIGVLSFIIIFQPEIRRALEHLGRSSFLDKHIFENDEVLDEIIGEITNAIDALSKSKTGALIIIEQTTGLEDIANTGTKLNADVSAALLENIFVVNTPLHDGAVIIRNNKILSAACILPLTNNNTINKKLGTRHRAAIGISENSDAFIIIVSEETGTISLAVNGSITRNYDSEKLKDILLRIIRKRNSKKSTIREQVKLWKEKVNKSS
ncbi:MAG: diadenylate cyclase CdaA [Solirubrobacterales bacterium]